MEKKHGQKKNINTKIVIAELHRAFKMFNEGFFEGKLPEPAILIQSRGNKKLTLGWCSVQKIWKNEVTAEEKYEINIVAEALNRGIYPVMTTLLHEMVHLHNLVNGIKDTSRGNTYHNMKFKQTAEAHGLIIEHAEKIGWSLSKLNGFAMDLIDENAFDEAVFSMGRRDMEAEGLGKRKKKKSSSRKYNCPECGTSIRASKDVNILCGDCSDLEEGKAVLMIKEASEEDEEDDNDSDEENKVEIICPECGCISNVDEGETICPECGADTSEEPAEEDADEEEGEEEIEEPAEEPTPAGIVEVETELNDGAGNMIPVKQGAFQITKTDWTEEKIAEVLKAFREVVKASGLEATEPDEVEIELSEKMKSQWALYKEGKKFTFSKAYLKEASDEEILDTIKHQYLHHYQWKVQGLKVNHKKDFKALCEQFGLSTELPIKNHRAMK